MLCLFPISHAGSKKGPPAGRRETMRGDGFAHETHVFHGIEGIGILFFDGFHDGPDVAAFCYGKNDFDGARHPFRIHYGDTIAL